MTTVLRCVLATAVAAVVISCSTPNSEASFCEASIELQKVDALSLEVSPSDDAAARGALTQTAAQAARVAREAPLEIRTDGRDSHEHRRFDRSGHCCNRPQPNREPGSMTFYASTQAAQS